MNYPVPNQVYTLRQLFELALRDFPCLLVLIKGSRYPIQDSHMTKDDFLSVDAIANTEWKYQRTTGELVPIFYAVNPIDHLLDIKYLVDEDSYWATFKAFPREFPN